MNGIVKFVIVLCIATLLSIAAYRSAYSNCYCNTCCTQDHCAGNYNFGTGSFCTWFDLPNGDISWNFTGNCSGTPKASGMTDAYTTDYCFVHCYEFYGTDCVGENEADCTKDQFTISAARNVCELNPGGS